ncbi:hypothetical protein E4T43_06065 [Aureobasidium subglaciale]|nr:hypothetical protein E4T43_06065 [Aureobasidium subglaciale]
MSSDLASGLIRTWSFAAKPHTYVTYAIWIYNAAVEISQSGTAPACSRDSWSFVPLDLEDIAAASQSVSASDLDGVRNIAFETYALSARLECRLMDYSANISAWLRSIDSSNRTIDPATNMSVWNSTNSPSDLDHGYTLTGWANVGPRFGHYVCCANDTFPGDAAIGYWNNRPWVGDPSDGYYKDMQMTMTAKLIVGRPLKKLYQPNPSETSDDPPLFIWPEPPALQMVNCTPFIEHTNASANADIRSGFVHSYEILGPPQNAIQAWVDSCLTQTELLASSSSTSSPKTLQVNSEAVHISRQGKNYRGV